MMPKLHKPIKCTFAAIAMLGVTTLSATSAYAEWTGGIEGGTVLSGDSENASRLRLKLSNDSRPLSHYIYADWIRSGNSDDSYELGYKPRYWVGEDLYVFGEARGRRESASSIDQSLSGLLGVGAQLIQTEEQSLFAELGAGYQTTEFSDDLEQSGSIGVARAGYRHVLADLILLELDADLDMAEELTTSILESGISLRVPGGSVKFSYRSTRYEVGDEDAVTQSDSFVSFSYGF